MPNIYVYSNIFNQKKTNLNFFRQGKDRWKKALASLHLEPE